MKFGKAIIVSAPSGAGKTTIVRHLLQLPLNLSFSVSACSRKQRENEKHGVDYYFLTADEFRKKISEGAFLEWEEVYEDHYYGTLKSEIERLWNAGKHIIFDVDVVGGFNLKRVLGDRALAIFVQPPSLQALEERLRNRKSESEEMLCKRVKKAEIELRQAEKFDVILVNDKLEDAKKEAEQMVSKFLES